MVTTAQDLIPTLEIRFFEDPGPYDPTSVQGLNGAERLERLAQDAIDFMNEFVNPAVMQKAGTQFVVNGAEVIILNPTDSMEALALSGVTAAKGYGSAMLTQQQAEALLPMAGLEAQQAEQDGLAGIFIAYAQHPTTTTVFSNSRDVSLGEQQQQQQVIGIPDSPVV